MAEPLRGAAPVNDELEVGYDAAFESKWRHIEVASQVCMGLVVMAALLGVFGRGPLSHRTHQTQDDRLAVDFEPIARYGTSTQVTFHLSADTSENGVRADGDQAKARVIISSSFIEPMGLQQVIPRPASTAAVGGDIELVFNLPDRTSRSEVRLVVKPNDVGPIRLEVRQEKERLDWTQFVVP